MRVGGYFSTTLKPPLVRYVAKKDFKIGFRIFILLIISFTFLQCDAFTGAKKEVALVSKCRQCGGGTPILRKYRFLYKIGNSGCHKILLKFRGRF